MVEKLRVGVITSPWCARRGEGLSDNRRSKALFKIKKSPYEKYAGGKGTGN